jgi:hypothetical protein
MDVSGKPHEGWMTTVPLVVFVLFVIGAMGGPVQFLSTVSMWVSDVSHYVLAWIRHL